MGKIMEETPQPGEPCQCGRPAVIVYVYDDRRTPYCGIPDGGR